MYLNNANSRYSRTGCQLARYSRTGCQLAGPGDFLILMQGESDDCNAVKAVVRSVRMRQLGHWMMGRIRIDGYKMSLSGAYGADGLICTVPDDIYRRLGLEIPKELYDQWNKGGGHNSCGSEAPSMRQWAIDNLKSLKAKPKKWDIDHSGSPCLEGMDTDELKSLESSIWKRPKSIGREWYGRVEGSEEAAKGIRRCIHWIIESREHRLRGKVDHAKYVEDHLLDNDYKLLPEFAKW